MRTIEFSIEWSNTATAVKVILKPLPHTVLYRRAWSGENSHRMSTHTGAGGIINPTSARCGLKTEEWLLAASYITKFNTLHFNHIFLFPSLVAFAKIQGRPFATLNQIYLIWSRNLLLKEMDPSQLFHSMIHNKIVLAHFNKTYGEIESHANC